MEKITILEISREFLSDSWQQWSNLRSPTSVSLFLFLLTGFRENMRLRERFLHGNSLGNAGVDCRRTYGMLKDVPGAGGCTGCWWMYGVLEDVRGAGGCTGCRRMYGVSEDVRGAGGCTGCWRMYGELEDVRGAGGCTGC